MNLPEEYRIEKVMTVTGMGRMQAINHLRQRDTLVGRSFSPRTERTLEANNLLVGQLCADLMGVSK